MIGTLDRLRARHNLARDARELVDLWLDLFRRHELLTYASAIARTLLVAGVAAVLLLLGVLSLLGDKNVWYRHFAPQIQPRLLPQVDAGIEATVGRILSANAVGLVAFATLLSIWEVSGSVRGVGGALNRIYETRETRPWPRRYLISIAIAAAILFALVSAILLVTAAGGLVHGIGSAPFAVARWATAIMLVTLAVGLLLHYAPAKKRATGWTSIGAVLVVGAWIVESLVFRWYVGSLANFHTAVGSLTVVLVVVSYLYTASIILLVGIELDELARAASEHRPRRAAG